MHLVCYYWVSFCKLSEIPLFRGRSISRPTGIRFFCRIQLCKLLIYISFLSKNAIYIWLQTERQKGFPGSLLNLENKYWTKSKECQNYDKKTISREFNFSLFEKPSFSREFDFKSSQKSNFSREYNFGNSTQICEFRKVFFQKKLPSVCKPIKLLCTRYIRHHPQV